MSNKSEETRNAAETAIQKHLEIAKLLEDIINLTYNNFKIVTKSGSDISGCLTKNFAYENIEHKSEYIQAHMNDIKTCYEQMGCFKDLPEYPKK